MDAPADMGLDDIETASAGEASMDLDVYDEWVQDELRIIGDLLEKEGVMTVLQTCVLMGKQELQEFAQDHAEGVQSYFHTPRRQRSGLLKGMPDKQERHAFLVAVLHEARCASALLEILCKGGVSAGANPSKAMMIGLAARAAREVAERLPSLYPFAEDHAFGMSLEFFSRAEE